MTVSVTKRNETYQRKEFCNRYKNLVKRKDEKKIIEKDYTKKLTEKDYGEKNFPEIVNIIKKKLDRLLQ